MVRVLFIAPFLHSYGSEQHLARDMARIPGVTVERIPEPASASGWAKWSLDLLLRAEDADLVLYTKGHGLPASAANLWNLMRPFGVQTASWHLDKYVGLRRQSEVGHDPFWKTGTVFTADGDPASAEYFTAQGVNHYWLPPAVVSDECTPGNAYSGVPPVVFVGSRNYHEEHPWRAKLLDGLEDRYGPQFGVYGQQGRIHGQALNDLYASTRVVVGDSLTLPGGSNFTSDRLPEVLGRGGFLVYPHIDGVAERFGVVDGEHFREYDYGDLDGLCALIDHYVAHPAEARAIAKRGRMHIATYHTYVERGSELLTVLGLL